LNKMSLDGVFEYNIKKAIEDYGQDAIIYYNILQNCSSCAYNPITKDATNSHCSTCNGTFFFNVTTSWPVKVIAKTFLGDKGYYDWVTRKINFYRGADVRLTCWLEDVLCNIHSVTGQTYFDKTDDIWYNTKHYSVKKIYKTGLKKISLCIINLEEIKK